MASQQGVYAFKKGRGKIKVQALKLEKELIFCTHVVRKQYYFSVWTTFGPQVAGRAISVRAKKIIIINSK